jgi:hypothetical protein
MPRYEAFLMDSDGAVLYSHGVQADDVWAAFEKVLQKHIARRPAGIEAIEIRPASS